MRLNVDQLTILQQKYQRLFNSRTSLVTLTVMEAFMTYFLVSIYCGIVLSSPWLFYQFWMFISAGLYPNEKKYVYMYLPLSLGLFLGGVALCEFVVLPLGVHYLLSFNEWLSVEPELRLSDWLNFAIMVPLIFGAAFQTPIIMLFLERMGIVDIKNAATRRTGVSGVLSRLLGRGRLSGGGTGRLEHDALGRALVALIRVWHSPLSFCAEVSHRYG